MCGPACLQEELFAQAEPLVDAALGGSNACVLAYGQTGSGKTYSMIGESANPGVVPRAVDRVWDAIEASAEKNPSAAEDLEAALQALAAEWQLFIDGASGAARDPHARVADRLPS